MTPEDKKKIGGSDVAALLGVSRYASAYSVYHRVVHGIEQDDNEAMKRGRLLEGVVLDWYAGRGDYEVNRNVSLTHLPAHERASLDGICRDRANGDAIHVVEAKTADWRSMADWGDEGTDAIPHEYLLQCQWYGGSLRSHPLMANAAHSDIIHVPAMVGGAFGLWNVRYDSELYGLLRECVAKFWNDHVVPRREPSPTSLRADREAVRKRFPKNTEKHLDWDNLFPEAQWLLVAYRQAARAVSESEKEREHLAVLVKALLGESSGVQRLPDGSRLNWKVNKDSKLTDWEAVAREMLGSTCWDDNTGIFTMLEQKHTTTDAGKRPLVWREKKAK